MEKQRKFFVGGNWKMNGSLQECSSLIKPLVDSDFGDVEVVVSPPFLYLDMARKLTLNSSIGIAAQNCYFEDKGAFTGEVSPLFLKDLNINYVILGHSERREIFKESDELVGKKVHSAIKHGLKVIACIGEKLHERENGTTIDVLIRQLNAIKKEISDFNKFSDSIVIAYEPVWAIGTGKVATPEQAQDAHVAIRNWLQENYEVSIAQNTRIIYGGSVNGENCKDLVRTSFNI
jgi:triosephosphate isomerase